VSLLENLKTAVVASVPMEYGRQPTRVGTKPWVVAWPDAGTVYSATMKWNDGEDLTITFRHYGLTPESAAFATKRVRTACLAQLHSTADGRQVWSVEQLTAVPLDREDETDPPAYVYADEYRFRSTPA